MQTPFVDLRRQFPVLNRDIAGSPLTYLDSAATTQMPEEVLRAMDVFLRTSKANAHRGMHPLAEEATDAYEGARETVRTFIGAAHGDEVVFTKSCTEAINIVARGMDGIINTGDVLALSVLEHHSNIVPWQQLAARTGATLRWVDSDDDGRLNASSLDAALSDPRLRLVAVTGMSNVLGTRPNLPHIIATAHAKGAWVLVDGSQLCAHDAVDVSALGCDFLTLSGHKLYGPTGIGVLYGRRERLAVLPPLLGGGGMIEEVTEEGFTCADAPQKFEAGTPPVAEAVGLAAAVRWMTALPLAARRAHEHSLFAHALSGLHAIDGLTVLGHRDPGHAEGVISFTVTGVHPHDLTSVLGAEGICLRAGHHCTQPLHRRLGIVASSRLSIGLYNSTQDIDRLLEALPHAIRTLTS